MFKTSDKFNEYLDKLEDAFASRKAEVVEAFLLQAQEELKDDKETFMKLIDAASAINRAL